MNIVQPLLTFFESHPLLSIAIVFVIAMAEALIVIGMFVPSTAVLIGAGALIGLGKLSFWPILIAAAVGAIVGDAISYWLGRHYGEHLKVMWPFRNYPRLISRGEEFFRSHGMKSIAIGRFIPGVKAIVPGVAGMMQMDRTRFTIMNAGSGIVWAAAHIVPGMLVGRGLSLAREFSPRLLALALAGLFLIALVAYAVRITVLVGGPLLGGMRDRLADFARQKNGPVWVSLARILDPDHPHALTLVVWGGVLVASVTIIIGLLEDVVEGGSFIALDQSISNFVQMARNAPGDGIMIAVTMMGDATVVTTVALAIIAWLVWQRSWYVAGTVSAAVLAASAFVPVLKTVLHRTRPAEFYSGAEAFSFPSGHTTLSATVFGILALLIAAGQPRWWRAIVYGMAAAVIAMIAFSRIYLLAHWPSDVIAGMAFGLAMTAAVAMALVGREPQHTASGHPALLAAIVFPLIVAGHLALNFDRELQKYGAATAAASVVIAKKKWLDGEWRRAMPSRGAVADEEVIAPSIQWAGPMDRLAASLRRAGWTRRSDWRWSDLISYLKVSPQLDELEPLPKLYQGRFPTVTFTKLSRKGPTRRLVARFWRSNYATEERGRRYSIMLGTISSERVWHPFSALTAVESSAVDHQILNAFAATLGQDSGIVVMRQDYHLVGPFGVIYLARPAGDTEAMK